MKLQNLLPHQLKQAVDEHRPLLLPVGCIEYHGPHLPLGTDTFVTETLVARVAARVPCVEAPPLWYGPTGYAVSGPDCGTVDVSTERFGRHVKDVLVAFWQMGFHWIIVAVHHQGLDGPEALAIRQAAAEVAFEQSRAERGTAWWGQAPLPTEDNVFERIQVWPSVLPAAAAATRINMSDHAGFFETSLVFGAHPELVELARIDEGAPWFCSQPGNLASAAGPDSGDRLLAAMVDAWVARLQDLLLGATSTRKA
jgi:creatinine amidohydrolase